VFEEVVSSAYCSNSGRKIFIVKKTQESHKVNFSIYLFAFIIYLGVKTYGKLPPRILLQRA
jgi:hypothetical protein